jgi:hypothetical protein
LDPNSLILTKDDLKFFRPWTGITNEEELREHIVDVAVRAYKVSVLPFAEVLKSYTN